jgi:hypothetical protein
LEIATLNQSKTFTIEFLWKKSKKEDTILIVNEADMTYIVRKDLLEEKRSERE